jgi:hypothetical protein
MTRSLPRIVLLFLFTLCFGVAPAPALEKPVAKSSSRTYYFSGRMLNAADFQREQGYMQRDRSSLAPYGQITGLGVTAERGSILVSPGMALSPGGDQIILPANARFDEPIADGKHYVVVCAVLHDLGRRCLLLAVVEQQKGRVRIERP